MKAFKVLIIFLTVLAIPVSIIGYYIGVQVFEGSMQMVTNQTTSLQTGYDYLEAEMFLRNGYNVVTYDQRSSGENTAQYTTYGYWESKDLIDYINYVDDQIDEDKKIITWGISFGGATVGIALGDEIFDHKVDYAILDCPISNMQNMLKANMEDMNSLIPTDILLFTGSFVTHSKLEFAYEDTEVTRYAQKTSVPTLIINSQADEVTPYYMGEDIYKALTIEAKKLYTVQNASHGSIYLEGADAYQQVVMDFLK